VTTIIVTEKVEMVEKIESIIESVTMIVVTDEPALSRQGAICPGPRLRASHSHAADF
jgi:hypothetical protein